MTVHDRDDDATRALRSTAPGAARGALPGERTDALPAGTRLHEFEIVSVIGQGGFGIVYLAVDRVLGREVALKEYLPAEMARRTGRLDVGLRSPSDADAFDAGLRSFVNEARLLARFDHPSLVKVHRFWEANGSAYMVMPYYAGRTLGRWLKDAAAPPGEAWLKALLKPLLEALQVLHDASCWHRDIAPDNILLLHDGRPLLLDFGAARHVIGDLQRTLTVIYKSGYAPVEQYGDVPGLAQGPWTDLYALGAVLHRAIVGRTPPASVQRYLGAVHEPLERVAAGRYGARFLRAIDHALALRPTDRPASVAAWRAELGLDDGQTSDPPAARGPAAVRSRSDGALGPLRRHQRLVAASALAACGVVGVAAVLGVPLWRSATVVTLPVAGVGGGPGASGPSGALPVSGLAPPASPSPAPAIDVGPPAPDRSDSTTATATAARPTAPTVREAAAPAPSPVGVATPRPRASDAPRTAAARERPVPVERASSRPRSPRCTEVTERVAIGEPLTSEEQTLLRRDCR